MNREISTSRAKTEAHSRLISLPAGADRATAQAWLDEVDSSWRALASHGASRLREEGWRRAGIGIVQLESPGFEELTRDLAITWATLDMKDRWGQTVVEVARRQRHWLTPTVRRVLDALAASSFDLYRVARRDSAALVLHRLRDDSRLTIHARMDGGAYPRGAVIVARVLEDGVARASLASAVVDPATVGLDRLSRGKRATEIRSRALFDAALDRFVRCASAARGDVLEPKLLSIGPRSYGRMARAFDALRRGFSLRGDEVYRSNDFTKHTIAKHRDGRLVISFDHEVWTMSPLPSAVSPAADRELAVQGGAGLHPTSIVTLEITPFRRPRSSDADAAARLCARAALAMIDERRAAA